MIRQILNEHIGRALGALGIADIEFSLEHPADSTHGDYATNVALIAAKLAGGNPRELAEQLAAKLRENPVEYVEKIEVAGPGFINFFLSPEFFVKNIQEILAAGENYGRNEKLKGKKVMVEYTDPNPFKVFHIGHLMTNVIGESLARLFEYSGAEVKRANYQGDVGLHVAKAIWGILKTQSEMPDESAPLAERTDYLGRTYTLGANAYEDDESAKLEINELNKKIYERSDDEVNRLYDLGRHWSLDHFEELYKTLGTRFDLYFFESDVAAPGKKIVQEYLSRGVFDESESAVVFRGEEHGLHTRVFLNKDGLPTYEAKELALAKMKYDQYPYDLSVVVTANEITEYFKVLLAAMKQVFPDLAIRTRHVGHGLLKLPTGKMSSRKGNVITGESLLQDAVSMAQEKARPTEVLQNAEREATGRAVGVGALKYTILRQAIGRDIIYDVERSFSLEGDSGPYLQYAYVRAISVLNKGKLLEIRSPNSRRSDLQEFSTSNVQMSDVERLIYQFPEVVERALDAYEPHYITTYLTGLAGAFNSYYASNRIIDLENLEVSSYRLALTQAVAITLKNGLSILGISAPERM